MEEDRWREKEKMKWRNWNADHGRGEGGRTPGRERERESWREGKWTRKCVVIILNSRKHRWRGGGRGRQYILCKVVKVLYYFVAGVS